VIDIFLKHLIPGINEHLSDDRLELLFCRDLSFTRRLIAKCHLVRCSRCRCRWEGYEDKRADEIISLYRDVLNNEEPEWPLEPVPDFARRLEVHLQQLTSSRRPIPQPKLHLPTFSFRNPRLVLYGALSCVVAIVLSLHQSSPTISSNILLARAVRCDSSNYATAPSVVYQSFRITTPKMTMNRSTYRDLQGKRLQKRVKLAETQEVLKTELAQVGVDWEQPMSASDYQKWHDQENIRTDQVDRVGVHLLKLTTTVPDRTISSQSLTVRDTDFHPIERTIAFRDTGTVEISELDFKVLPFAAVDANVFDPLGTTYPVATSGTHLLGLPKIPQVATQGQLDEAELSTRLMLNQLHADDGEQIEIHRRPEEVVVEGVVETDERKRELQAQLRLVPHVTVAIQSEIDLKNAPLITNPASIQVASMPYVASPLDRLLGAHGRSVNDASTLALRLSNASLTIMQESKAIVDLQTRFDSDERLTVIGSATLSELLYSHRERLKSALKSERTLIAEAQITPAPVIDSSESRNSSLLEVARQNLALSKELTLTANPSTRSAEQILAEMAGSLDELTIFSRDVYRKPQGVSPLSGKK